MDSLISPNIFLNIAQVLAIQLPDFQDRAIANKWIKKLSIIDSDTRDKYLPLLVFCLQQKRLVEPFSNPPSDFTTNLQPFDKEYTLLGIKAAIQEAKLRDAIIPPYKIDMSQDLREFAVFQEIPNFGSHFYFAVSTEPIMDWQKFSKLKIPRELAPSIFEDDLNECKELLVPEIDKRANVVRVLEKTQKKIHKEKSAWKDLTELNSSTQPSDRQTGFLNINFDGSKVVPKLPSHLQKRLIQYEEINIRKDKQENRERVLNKPDIQNSIPRKLLSKIKTTIPRVQIDNFEFQDKTPGSSKNSYFSQKTRSEEPSIDSSSNNTLNDGFKESIKSPERRRIASPDKVKIVLEEATFLTSKQSSSSEDPSQIALIKSLLRPTKENFLKTQKRNLQNASKLPSVYFSNRDKSSVDLNATSDQLRREEVNDLNKVAENVINALDTSIHDILEKSDIVSERLSPEDNKVLIATAGNLVESLCEQKKNIKSMLNRAYFELSYSELDDDINMSQSIEIIQDIGEGVLDNLEKLEDNAMVVMDELQELSQEISSNLAKTFNQDLIRKEEEISEILGKMRETLKDQVNAGNSSEIAATVQEISEKTEELLNSTRDLTEDVRKLAKEANIQEQLNKSLKSMGQLTENSVLENLQRSSVQIQKEITSNQIQKNSLIDSMDQATLSLGLAKHELSQKFGNKSQPLQKALDVGKNRILSSDTRIRKSI